MQNFGAQEIVDTLHIMEKQRYKAKGLLLALERLAVAISGEFKPQNVANTLWADLRVHDMRVNAKSSAGLRQGGQWSSTGPRIFLTCSCQLVGP